MGLGMKKFTPLSQNSILGKKKGGGHPKSGKISTNSDLAETFKISPGLRNNGIGNEKFHPHPPKPKTGSYAKKGEAPQIRQKFNQLGFGSNFQGNLRPKNDCFWR